jgi:hypothetical protein
MLLFIFAQAVQGLYYMTHIAAKGGQGGALFGIVVATVAAIAHSQQYPML